MLFWKKKKKKKNCCKNCCKNEKLRKWALEVKKRDGRCLRCGRTKYLEAHHILAKSKHPKQAYKVSNGATLCKYCHRLDHDSYHKIYGTTKSNRQMFNNWLKATNKRFKRAFTLTFFFFIFIVAIVSEIAHYFITS